MSVDDSVSVPVTRSEKGTITPALLPYRLTEGKRVEGAAASTALVKAAYRLGHGCVLSFADLKPGELTPRPTRQCDSLWARQCDSLYQHPEWLFNVEDCKHRKHR